MMEIKFRSDVFHLRATKEKDSQFHTFMVTHFGYGSEIQTVNGRYEDLKGKVE